MDELYAEVYIKLLSETAIINFTKSNGQTRDMIATRSNFTAGLFGYSLSGMLNAFDKRNNRGNLNISVIDLELGECRSFHLPRVNSIQWLGEVNTEADVDKAIEAYKVYKGEQAEEKLDETSFDEGFVFGQ